MLILVGVVYLQSILIPHKHAIEMIAAKTAYGTSLVQGSNTDIVLVDSPPE